MKAKGRYFKSEKEYTAATGKKVDLNSPNIHVSGSVRSMRKLYCGYECDVVRIGNYIYKV